MFQKLPMPFVYDHIHPSYKCHATEISYFFNGKEAQGKITQPLGCTKFHYEHVGRSAGVSTAVTLHCREHLVDNLFILVVCEDVEAFLRHQMNQLSRFSLNTFEVDQEMLEPIIYVMCQCLENSLKLRTEKLKVEQFFLSVLEISQVVSAVNLLDREVLWLVTVHLPFDDQVFKAEDFIPLIEGQGRQRLDLRILLNEFSLQLLEEVRKVGFLMFPYLDYINALY